ncbi:GAF domain-containing sensor histidine kinase [Actinomadura sp. HBU206391]|nr:GAF domain-containing sensor histidine kinase [Actinomadura sp. HBU206391]
MSAAVLAVTRHLSVHEVFQVIVRAAAQLLDARYAALGVPDDEGSFAEFVVEGVSDEEWDAIGPLPRQHGMLAVMLREPRAHRLADIRKEPDFDGWPTAHPILKDFLGVPIRDGDQTVGIIFLANKRTPGGFTEDDEELLTLFAAHAAMALTNARLHERARELTVVEERNRLARELHDAVAQKLFSLRLTARAAAALAEHDPVRTIAELEQVERLAGEALAELRAVIFELRPADLADGLLASLRKHVEVLDRAYGAELTFSADQSIALTGEREAVVFRVAQEALYNALRHARATRIAVTLSASVHHVILEVQDDGGGFDAAAESGRDGLGLTSMRDRAMSVGGSLTIGSGPGGGALVRLEVPL